MLVNDMEHENLVRTVTLVTLELKHKAPCLDFIPKVCAGKVHLQTSSPPDKAGTAINFKLLACKPLQKHDAGCWPTPKCENCPSCACECMPSNRATRCCDEGSISELCLKLHEQRKDSLDTISKMASPTWRCPLNRTGGFRRAEEVARIAKQTCLRSLRTQVSSMNGEYARYVISAQAVQAQIVAIFGIILDILAHSWTTRWKQLQKVRSTVCVHL